MVFLSNYLVFKIVAAAVTGGRIDYPVASDLEIKYDDTNKVYLSGGSVDYVDEITLWTTIGGETNDWHVPKSLFYNKLNKTTTTAHETSLPANSVHGTFGINQDATRYVHQYPVSSGYQNGKFQVYSGTPSGGYTAYGSEITPFGGNETVLCSMSADGKYILVTTYNGGNDGYKMYKDNGSSYAYHSAYSLIGSKTTTGYQPAFVPSNNNFVITGTNNSTVWLFKLYVYDSDAETWTAKDTVTPSGSPTTDSQRGQFGKGFTYDGSYFFQSCEGVTTQAEVWSVDWDANTMTKVWDTAQTSPSNGAGGAISPDNKYVVLSQHDGDPYAVFENTSGDWSTTVNVSSEFDLTGTSTVFGSYGIGFSGCSSTNTTPLYIGQVGGFYGDGKFRLENWSTATVRRNYYITEVGKYSADVKIGGLNYKTNEVTVSGSITSNTNARLEFNGYNKLSLANAPTNTSSRFSYGSNVYDIGTLTNNLVIESAGTYRSLVQDIHSNVAYFSSNVVSAVSSVIANPVFTSATAITTDTNWTSGSGWVITEDSTASSAKAGWKVFDNIWTDSETDNQWETDGVDVTTSNPAWVQIKYPSAYKAVQYSIQPKEMSTPKYPKTWKFQGSNDGGTSGTWVDLDTQTDKTDWAGNNTVMFTGLSTSTAYQYFRLYVTDTDGSAGCIVRELKVYTLVSGSQVGNVPLPDYTYPTTINLDSGQTLDSASSLTIANDSHQVSGGKWYRLNHSNYTVKRTVFWDDVIGDWSYYDTEGNRPDHGWDNPGGVPGKLEKQSDGDLKLEHGSNASSIAEIKPNSSSNPWPSISGPSLDFDTDNKLSISGITPTSSTLKYLSNTYDIGTTTNVYIKHAGTYDIETKSATTFALTSNIVSGTVSEPTISGPVSIYWNLLDYSKFDGTGGKAAIASGSDGISFSRNVIGCLKETSNATPVTSPYVGTTIDLTNVRPGIDNNFKYRIPFKPKTQSFELSFKASQPSSGTSFQVYMGYLTLDWSGSQNWNTSGDTRQKVVNLYAEAGSSIYLASITGQSMSQSSYTYDSTKPFVITSDESTLEIEHNGNSKSIDVTATHEDSSGSTVADPEYYLWMAFNENTSDGKYNVSDITYSIDGEVIKGFPTFSLKGYNNLYFSNIVPTTSNVTLTRSGEEVGNTYYIGTATDIYIKDVGTYDAEIKSADTFALTSNVVSAFVPDVIMAPSISSIIFPDGGWQTGLWSHDTTQDVSNVNMIVKVMEPIGDDSGTITRGWSYIYYKTGVKAGKQFINVNFPDPDNATGNSPGGIKRIRAGVTTGSQSTDELEYATGDTIEFYNKPGTGYDVPLAIFPVDDSMNFYTAAVYNTKFNPGLTFDTYNKLSINNITPTSTSLKYFSNTYDIGTMTNIYIEDAGTYEIETKSATTFALTSNVVSGTIKTIEPVISGGYGSGHALTYDGKLYGWGANGDGELGVGDTSTKTVPTLCTGITQGEVSSIWIRNPRSQTRWAKTTDGKIWVTGKGDHYCIPGQTSDQTSFINVSSYFGDQSLTANNITQIRPLYQVAAALTETGNVWTWGTHDSTFWNLGQGTGAASSNTPKQITFGGATGNITTFATGLGYAVALDSDGDVWFWGSIVSGYAGMDYPQATLSTAQKSPHEIMTSNNIVGVASSHFTIFAWQSDGTYYGLGADGGGQIGDGTTTAGGHNTWQKVEYFSSKGITINSIQGGTYHIVADTSDGLYCWGDNSEGQLGLGHTTDQNSPVKCTQVSNIKKFSAGDDCTYAIAEDGKYYAWGSGTSNKRGDNATDDISSPKYIDTLPNILAPSFDFDGYKLVLKNMTPTSTSLKYFSNTYDTGTATNIYVKDTGAYTAEIGKNATDFVLTSNTVSGTIKTVTPAIFGGYEFAHALAYDGKLYGWGANDDGELGVGDTSTKTVPTLCTGITQGEVESIWRGSIRAENRWAKTTDGKIWVTGKGDSYCIPGQTSDQTSFIDVSSYFGDQSLTANTITQISVQGYAVAALTETGNVWTWGTHDSTKWRLGQGTGASSSNTPKQITISNITAFTCGHDHAVALDSDGDVWFWGQIWNGGAGVDYPQATLSTAQKSPHEIMTSNNIVGVSSTHFTIFAWQSDGTYYALGGDYEGQIGDGTATTGGHNTWQKVEYFSSKGITINEIYGGTYHVFADTSDGYYCWGNGGSGVFGNGTTGNLSTPVKWTHVSNIKKFGMGENCTYAIAEDGKYYAWGSGSSNKRGDNDTGSISYPKYINTLPNILGPSFEFDGYDKMASFNTSNNAPETVKFTKNTIEYDASTAQIITVSDSGTYDAQLSGSNVFTLKSATVPATSSTGLYTWAFHHGNFDNAYGDGDIFTARDNGRFYADTPAFTSTSIGTITPGATTTSNTTYTFAPPSGGLTANVLMVAGGGGGAGGNDCGGGGAGGLVYTTGTSLASGSTKTIVVGNGDSGGYGEVNENGYDGKDTTFTGLTTADGGGGGGKSGTAGVAGGSGGGGGQGASGGAAASGSQGTAGGAGGGTYFGGGGGGAGAAGSDYSGNYAGDGGIGKLFGTGSSFTNFGDEYGEGGWFASGGGGGVRDNAAKYGGTPGRGGGGYGATYYGYMGINDSEHGGSQHGMVHTGGGGGGSGTTTRDQHPGYAGTGNGKVTGHGGRGGSGIVLIQTNVAPPNGANTAVVQVGNPRRRSLPTGPYGSNMYTGAEVNRFYIIDSQSMPTYKLPTHWYVDPPSYNGNHVFTTQGSHSLQKRADGGTSNVWYASSAQYFAEYGNKMAQSADAIFMPLEAQRYDVLLSIGANAAHDIQLEMAADGTAKLYRDNGATLLQAGTITCFTVGKWHHIALTVDSEHNAVGYVNGYPVVSTTYTSNPDVGSRTGNMHLRVGVTATFRKYLTYEVSTYNFHMTPKQVHQRAVEVGCRPKLEYDGLNTIKILNAEPGSTVNLCKNNTGDTSNVFVVADGSITEYTVGKTGSYYATISGTDTYTVTKSIDVTGTLPLYQYPPTDGSTSSLTESAVADTFNTWTISGAANGNGQYQVKSGTAAATGNHYDVLRNNVGSTEKWETGTSPSYPITFTIQLPSAKTIRKYRMFPLDHDNPNGAGTSSTPGTSVNPVLAGDSGGNATKRPKSWVFKGSSNGTSWTDLDTVTNKPISIYGDVYSVDSPASYQYYQVSVSANNGGNTLLLGDIQIWGDA